MVFGFINKLVGKDKELVKEGNVLFNKGEYDKALKKYKEALWVNKDNADAKNKIEKIEKIKYLKDECNRLFNCEDYGKALEKFKEILILNPNDKEVNKKRDEIEEKELQNIKSELDNLNLSNYKEIYNKYKDIFDRNESALIYYINNLIDWIIELGNNENRKPLSLEGHCIRHQIDSTNREEVYKLTVEVGVFLLDVLGVERLDELIKIKDPFILVDDLKDNKVNCLSIRDDIVVWGCGYDSDLGYAPVCVLSSNAGKKIWEVGADDNVIWNFKAKDSVYCLSIKDDIVLLGCSNGYVYALDLNNGREIWKFEAEGIVRTLSIKDGILIVGCESCYYDRNKNKYIKLGYSPVYALDLRTGNEIWEYKTKRCIYELSIKDDIIVLGCENGYVCTLSLNTGRKIWDKVVDDSVYGSSIKDDIIVLGCGDHYVHALSLNTGGNIWEFNTKVSPWSLSIKDNIVIVGCRDGYIYALDLNGGREIWNIMEWIIDTVCVIQIKDNILLLGYDNGHVCAFDLNVIKNYKLIQKIKQPLKQSLKVSLNSLISQMKKFSDSEKAKKYLTLAKDELYNGNYKKSYGYIRLAQMI